MSTAYTSSRADGIVVGLTAQNILFAVDNVSHQCAVVEYGRSPPHVLRTSRTIPTGAFYPATAILARGLANCFVDVASEPVCTRFTILRLEPPAFVHRER